MKKDKLLGTDLWDIRPPSLPIGILMYVDYKYETLVEKRMKKIKIIKEKIWNEN